MKVLAILSIWALALFNAAFGAEVVPRATFTEVTSYGPNPTNTRMWLYVPRNLAPNPAIVVGIHWCSGSAQAYYQGTQWARYSETYGYIVIYPQTPYTSSNCWDVASKMTLTHNGGGSSTSIANMVSFVTQQYSADKSKVYVTGTSSGAMMTVSLTIPNTFAIIVCYIRSRFTRMLWRRPTRICLQPALPTQASQQAVSRALLTFRLSGTRLALRASQSILSSSGPTL